MFIRVEMTSIELVHLYSQISYSRYTFHMECRYFFLISSLTQKGEVHFWKEFSLKVLTSKNICWVSFPIRLCEVNKYKILQDKAVIWECEAKTGEEELFDRWSPWIDSNSWACHIVDQLPAHQAKLKAMISNPLKIYFMSLCYYNVK